MELGLVKRIREKILGNLYFTGINQLYELKKTNGVYTQKKTTSDSW